MDDDGAAKRSSHFRWWICALLFCGTTICYLDRQVISILKPNLSRDLHMNEAQYGTVVLWFQALYAAGYLLAGRLNDIVKVRRGYALAMLVWSLAAVGHTFVRAVGTLLVARSVLGFAEGGNFPASIRAVSEWFPRRERALATGVFNSGSNVGVMVSALLVPWLTVSFGWRIAFLGTGVLGLLWLTPWLIWYRAPAEHPSVGADELAAIEADPPDPPEPISWGSLLLHRSTWAYIVGTLLTSPVWWFYLFWVPDFLYKTYKFEVRNIGLPLILVYLIASAGSVGGGWLSSALIARGWSVNAARKTGLLTCALCVVPVFFASQVANPWVATLLIGIAAAAHQGWSANLYTFVSDTTPRKAVSSVVGMGGMAGAVGGMYMAKFVGELLQASHNSYVLLFAIAPCAYLSAIAIMQILVPRIEAV